MAKRIVRHLNGWVIRLITPMPIMTGTSGRSPSTIRRANAWFDATQVSSHRVHRYQLSPQIDAVQWLGWKKKTIVNAPNVKLPSLLPSIGVPETERLKIEGYLARWLMSTMFTASHPYFDRSIQPHHSVVKMQRSPFIGENQGNVAAIGPTASKYPEPMGWSRFHPLTGLIKGTTYYYTSKVSNSGGDVWGSEKLCTPTPH